MEGQVFDKGNISLKRVCSTGTTLIFARAVESEKCLVKGEKCASPSFPFEMRSEHDESTLRDEYALMSIREPLNVEWGSPDFES